MAWVSFISFTRSAFEIVPSANKCYLITAKSGTVGLAICKMIDDIEFTWIRVH